MDLSKIIKQLLQDREIVILSGFGNLVMKDSGPEIFAAGSKLAPPGLSIKFDASFSKDDRQLSALYASEADIPIEEAEQQVLEFIDEIRFALDKGETYEVPQVGTFFRDDDQKVRFEIDPSWIIDPEQYGLDSLDLLELEEEPIEEIKEGIKETDFQLVTDPIPAAPAPAPSSHKPVKKWRIIWIIAASLILILILIIVIPVNDDGKRGLRFSREGIILQQTNTEKEVAPVTSEISEETESIFEEAQAEVVEEEIIIKETPVVQNKYFIIAGSFSRLSNASDLQDRLKSEGFSSEIIITENKMYRVSLNSYPTKIEALQELRNLKSADKFKSCWLLTN